MSDSPTTALQRQYQQALARKNAAEQRYENLTRASKSSKDDGRSIIAGESILDQYLTLQRLQSQQAKLVSHRDELDIWKAAKQTLRIPRHATFEAILVQPSADSAGSAFQQELSALTHALELAVVRAHREAVRERALLGQAQQQLTTIGGANEVQRARALLAVQQHLTAWVRSSLDGCHEETIPLKSHNAKTDAESSWDERIEDEYEHYLDARRRLIAAVTALSTPLPDAHEATTIHNGPENMPDSIPPNTDVLSIIETALLPAMSRHELIHAHNNLARSSAKRHEAAILSMVERLSDESQLLQAFPFLAGTGRFQHATAVFGKSEVAKVGLLSELSKVLQPWSFAAQASDTATELTASQQLQQSEKAMAGISRHLLELKLLKEVGS
jgi:hypothetical protein